MSMYRPGAAAPADVDESYLFGDRSPKVTATQSGFVDKAPEVFANVMEVGYASGARWRPNANTAMTSSQVLEFVFAEAVTLQSMCIILSTLSYSWGTVQVSVFRNGAYQALDATNALGVVVETVIAIDADKQAGVSKIKLVGVSGTMSATPWCYGIRFVALVEAP